MNKLNRILMASALLLAGLLTYAKADAATQMPSALNPTLGPVDVQDGKTFRVLAFHDVRTNVRQSFARDPEESAMDETTLAGLFSWLKAQGWKPVSLEQIARARAGGAPLPEKAVLLTFDDGYASHYTKVFPLLRRFNYPAVMALVTSWMEVPAGGIVQYGMSHESRDRFLTWEQAREMTRSGLVELASHSHNLHRGAIANPQGNTMPATTTHKYDEVTRTYETDQQWLERVVDDLALSSKLIEQHTGQRVRSLVWPYGAWNDLAQKGAERAGMPIAFTLEDGPNTAAVPLSRVRRGYVTYDIDPPGYLSLLRQRADVPATRPIQRAMHVDLDYVYDPDPEQQERNLSKLLERVLAASPRSVFLQAYADPDGDGVADAVYFPNRHMPVRADLFSRVAWQLRTRSRVEVFAWMPVMAFKLPASTSPAPQTVTIMPGAKATGAPRYHRLSPFDPAARSIITDIYDDLGRYSRISGVLFHDDATLADDEDSSPAALATYREWGLPGDVAAIRADKALSQRWAQLKTSYLTDFTLTLADKLKSWQPRMYTARNLYARPVLDPNAREWMAQDYEQSLAAYDYVAVMAMPFMEEVSNPSDWLTQIAKRVAATPLGIERTIFELQAKDWRTGKPVADAEFTRQWTLLRRLGARHMAYYPDDFLADQPKLATVRSAVSVTSTVTRTPEGFNRMAHPQGAPLPAPAPAYVSNNLETPR